MARRAVVGAAAGLLLAAAAAAQGVMIAPHAVVIDHRTRSGSVTLYNPNAEPAEVTISVIYGYPVTDSAGNISLYAPEHPDSTEPSASGWIQAFPRRLTVMPLERQIVRLLARPPASLPDGEYWARLVVATKGGAVPVSGVPDTSQIHVGLNLEVRSVLGVYYRKGAVKTGLRVSRLRATVEGDSLVARVRLERSGNAAFLGTVHGTLTDSTGARRAQFDMPLGVFTVFEPRFATAVGMLPRGRYTLRFVAEAVRSDLPGLALPLPAVRDSVEVRVP